MSYNKYKNKKTTIDGFKFDSEMESHYYLYLKQLKEIREVVDFVLQPTYLLQEGFTTKDGVRIRPIKYIADFRVIYKDGHEEVIDTKGCPDSVAILKRKLFWYQYPTVDYKWVCYSKIDGGWCDYEYVKKQRAERKRNKKL